MTKRKAGGRGRGDGGSLDGGPSGEKVPGGLGALAEGEEAGPAEEEKPRKWARKMGPGRRKSVLTESFPLYMQVGTAKVVLGFTFTRFQPRSPSTFD